MLLDEFPDIAQQWSEKNALDISEIPAMSGKKAIWECNNSHEWEAKVASRALGSGCPYCSGRLPIPGETDLATIRPDLARQWSPKNTKNPTEFKEFSKTKVWWTCPTNSSHEWEASVATRAKGHGCPYCSGRKSLGRENSLLNTHPDLAAQWHPTKNYKRPHEITKGSHYKAWWNCGIEGHDWEAEVHNRSIRSGCPVCKNKIVIPGINDLSTTRPDLASQWHHTKNDRSAQQVSSNSDYLSWWTCGRTGHVWSARVYIRSRGSSCPFCSNRRSVGGSTDLETTHPDLASQWSLSRNSGGPQDVTYTNVRKVWWVCIEGHEWESSVSSRSSGHGCPYCSGRLVTPGFNDLSTTHPNLINQWGSKNTKDMAEVSAGSDYKANWICSKGHEWSASVYNRTGNGSGCPDCAATTFSSKGQKEVYSFILQLFPDAQECSRSVVKGHELDIYIPSKNVGIEYNGLYMHSTAIRSDPNYHHKKQKASLEVIDKLIHVWEDDWKDNPEVVKSMLKHKLGVSDSPRVYARKTSVDPDVALSEAQSFMLNNHIQGYAGSTYRLGLRDSDQQLVALMLLKRTKNQLELVRYATSAQVVGGQGKLLKYADQNLDYEQMVTFADLLISNGDLYEKTGWTKDKELRPDYSYYYKGKRVHKFNFRLKRFRTDPNLKYDPDMTERQLAELNKIPRIYDAGKIRYVRSKP